MHKNRITLAVMFALSVMGAKQLLAQHWFEYSAPPREFDWQLFSPEVDLDPQPTRAPQGYFGNCERTHTWMLRPERAPLGAQIDQPVAVYIPSNVNFAYFPVDTATLLTGGGATYVATANSSLLLQVSDGGGFSLQSNSIDDAYTETGRGWGNRYEFGWVEGRTGWMISGHYSNIRNSNTYGLDNKRREQLAAAQGNDGIDGILDPDGDGIFNAFGATGGTQAIPGIDGLYSVHVVFNDPRNLLLGYVDFGGNITPGLGGLIFPPGVDANGNLAFFDNIFGADGIPGTADDPPPGTFSRVRIGVVFDQVQVENEMDVAGVELSGIRTKRPLGGGSFGEVYLGVRYLELDDLFYVLAKGGVLTDSEWRHNAVNRLVGPQVGFRISKYSHRWSTQIQARLMAATNFTSIRQNGHLGNELRVTSLVPGTPNAVGGTEFFHRFSESYFSPTGEFRVEMAAKLTKYVSIKGGWTGLVAGNITRASNTVRYDFPSLGIAPQNEALFSSTASLGVEINR